MSGVWTRFEERVPIGMPSALRPIVRFTRPGSNLIVRVPAVLGDRYKVDSLLAAGGMGAVIVASDQRLGGRKVLVKVALLDERELFNDNGDRAQHDVREKVEALRERLLDERNFLIDFANRTDRLPAVRDWVLDYAAQLHGPHGRGGHYWNQQDAWVSELLRSEPYLVLQYIPGRPLRRAIDSAEFGGVGELARLRRTALIARELCSLLSHFHDRQKESDRSEFYFVYQDLKPDNVILTEDDLLFLIDFGVVCAVTVQRGAHIVSEESVFGTEGYRAPETRGSPARVDERSDIFSLGATLYHILAQKTPDEGMNLEAAFADLERVYVNGRNGPGAGGLLKLVARCMAHQPAARVPAPGDLSPIDALREEFISVQRKL